jgi:hypothetical protein
MKKPRWLQRGFFYAHADVKAEGRLSPFAGAGSSQVQFRGDANNASDPQ